VRAAVKCGALSPVLLALLLLAAAPLAAQPGARPAPPLGKQQAAAARGAADAGDGEYIYRAVPGDTLIGLSRRLLRQPRRWPALARLNRLRDPDLIPVGLALRIPLAWLRTQAVPATLLGSIGELQAPPSLVEGSELRTGADGHAVVRLVDGSLLTLRPHSRLQISESRRLPQTDLVRARARLPQGQVEVQATPARAGSPGFRIETPQGVLGVRGTRFRVAVTPEQARGEVLSGVVAFQGAGPPQLVHAAQGSLIDAAGAVSAATPLLAAPPLPGALPTQDRPLVRLAIPPVSGAVAYRAQIVAAQSAEPTGYALALADLSTRDGELRVAGLPDGDYRLRLRAVDALGLEGMDAQATFRLDARPEPPLLSAPAAQVRLAAAQAVDFRWARNPQAASYRLQIAAEADAGFAQPLRELQDLVDAQTAVGGLGIGRYRWRMRSQQPDGELGPWGDAQGFDLRAGPPAAPRVEVQDRRLLLAWQGAPGQQFDLQLARSADFAAPLWQQRLAGSEAELPHPGGGRFWVRLRAIDPDGWVGPFSAPQFLDVPLCLRDAAGDCVRQLGQPVVTTP